MERKAIQKIRKRRLRLLVDELGGPKALADLIPCEPNYISQLLGAKKSFAENAARNIERAARKPERWLDTDEDIPEQSTDWPFRFVDRALWDRLTPAKKNDIEDSLQKLILGASVQEATAAPQRSHRRKQP